MFKIKNMAYIGIYLMPIFVKQKNHDNTNEISNFFRKNTSLESVSVEKQTVQIPLQIALGHEVIIFK